MLSLNKKRKIEKINRLRVESDYRGLSDIQLAAKLIVDEGSTFSECLISEAISGLSSSSVHRAKKAVLEGREPGKNGRPRGLNPRQEEELNGWIHECITSGIHPTYNSIGLKVYKYHSFI